jgi:hypothetical protein|tara:strand:+ start:2876 stop:3712 length:837 start_codon:yes stop_codon:yes gene_type:complete
MSLYLPVLDVVVVGSVLVTFTVYYIYYGSQAFDDNNSSKTQLGRNLNMVGMWSVKHFESKDAATTVLAVQTLRNSLISAIFIGGAALGAASNVIQPPTDDMEWTPALQVRQIILSSLLCCSFLSWALVIRYNTHLGFMVGGIHVFVEERKDAIKEARQQQKKAEEDAGITDLEAQAIVEGSVDGTSVGIEEEMDLRDEKEAKRAALADLTRISKLSVLHQAWGFRFIFFAVPFFFYSAGPIALLIASVLVFLYLLIFHDNSVISMELAVKGVAKRIDK